MKAKALVFTAPGVAEVRGFDLRDPGPGEVLIESHYTCISPGTELRRFRGREALGGVRYPFVPGYCLAGRVVATGQGVDLQPGTPVVSCGTVDAGGLQVGEGGHVSHAVAPATMVLPVPESVDLVSASAVILAGIAWHGLLQSRPRPGESVAVLGLGVIGQLAARLHAAAGAQVVGCDLSAHRVRVAAAAGIAAFVADGDLGAAFGRHFPNGAEIIVDATGAPAVVQTALRLGRRAPWSPFRDTPGVRYLVHGSFEGEFAVSYPDAYAVQLQLLVPRGSQVSDWQAALNLLAQGRYQVRDLVSAVREPATAAAVYAELEDPQSQLLTAAFRWC